MPGVLPAGRNENPSLLAAQGWVPGHGGASEQVCPNTLGFWVQLTSHFGKRRMQGVKVCVVLVVLIVTCNVLGFF